MDLKNLASRDFMMQPSSCRHQFANLLSDAETLAGDHNSEDRVVAQGKPHRKSKHKTGLYIENKVLKSKF